MESVPIRINEADLTTLQQLHGIGPGRAQRIMRFREDVAPITSLALMQKAAGLSQKQAEAIADHIDFYSRRPATPWIALAVTAGIIMLSLWQLRAEATTPAALLHGYALITLLTTCALMVVRELLETSLAPLIDLMVMVAAGATCFLLPIPTVYWLLSVTVEPPATQLHFISFVLVLLYFLAGPTLLHTLVQHTGRTALLWIYELSFIPAALAGLAAVYFIETGTRLEELFALWLGVMIANNGYDHLNGKLVGINGPVPTSALQPMRYEGVALIVMGFNLTAFAILKLVGWLSPLA